MKNALKVAAAIALTGFSFAANAQATKPMKDGKVESKTESKKTELKEEKMEAKGDKMHHGKMHSTKTATKAKM